MPVPAQELCIFDAFIPTLVCGHQRISFLPASSLAGPIRARIGEVTGLCPGNRHKHPYDETFHLLLSS